MVPASSSLPADDVDPSECQRQQQARRAGRDRIEDLEADDFVVEAGVGEAEPRLLLALRAVDANRAQRRQPLGQEMRKIRHRLAHAMGPLLDPTAERGRREKRQARPRKLHSASTGDRLNVIAAATPRKRTFWMPPRMPSTSRLWMRGTSVPKRVSRSPCRNDSTASSGPSMQRANTAVRNSESTSADSRA